MTKATPKPGLAGQLRQQAVDQFGNSQVLSTEAYKEIVRGVPLSGMLPLQYIVGVNVLPVHRVIGVVGQWGATKTTFSWQLAKLFNLHGGMVLFVGIEGKTSDEQGRGIYQDDEFFDRGVLLHESGDDSVEECLGKLVWYCKEYEKLCPGRDVPFLIILDSLNALMSDEAKEAATKGESPAGYSNPRKAQIIKDKIQVLNNTYLQNNPITLCLINHQSTKITEGRFSGGGAPAYTEPGGGYKDYQMSLKFTLRKDAPLTRDGIKHPVVKMTCGKTGYGPMRHKPIKVTLQSDWVLESRGYWKLQYLWDASLAYLLTEKGNILKGHTDGVLTVSGSGNKYSCEELGLTGVSADELGAALHSSPEMVDILTDHVLRIMRKEKISVAS